MSEPPSGYQPPSRAAYPAAYGGEGGGPADPSFLTTRQLLREIETLKELVLTRIDALQEAATVFSADMKRVPTDVDRQVQQLQALHEQKFETIAVRLTEIANLQSEKFHSIQTQFVERDVRAESSARDSKTAVDAALQAAKEAVAEQNRSSALAIAKSEAATSKQIDQLAILVATATKSLDEKIDDSKARLQRLEGQALGTATAQTGHQANTGLLASIVFGIIGALVGISGLLFAFFRK